MKLTITAESGATFSRYLEKHLRAAHRILKPRLAELSVVLVNDRTMSQLHQRFMQIAGPTDVLTFPLELDSRQRVLSGEVVICVPEARRRAREMKVAVQDELLLYALHGMLHLCGFDDRTAAGFRRMHQMEDKILRRLGVGPIFKPLAISQMRHERTKGRSQEAKKTRRRFSPLRASVPSCLGASRPDSSFRLPPSSLDSRSSR